MARPDKYLLRDGSQVVGTTTVIGRFKDSGGLLFWAFGQGKLAERGVIKNLYDKRDEAADLGTRVHELCETHIHGQAVDLATEPEEVRSGFEAYLSWERQSKLRFLETEFPLVCDCHKFGGTPDGIVEIDGKIALVDFKTSNGVYPDYLIQLAAYKHLIECGYRMDTGQPTNYRLDGGFHLLRFAKEFGDFGHHFFPNLDSAWRQFELFREAYEIDKELKRRTK